MTITYEKAHEHLGSASSQICPCGKQAKQWAYQHTGKTLYSPEGRAYSESSNDYLAMCVSCHQKLDIAATPDRYRHLALSSAKGRAVVQERQRTDPEFAERQKAALARGRVKLREMLDDPEFVQVVTAPLKKRRRCLACGKESTIGAIATHQKYSNHQGFQDLC